MREITVSGVRPTGKQHLGNYLGAVVNFVKMQDLYNGFFFIADLHSLTTHPKAADLQANVRQTLIIRLLLYFRLHLHIFLYKLLLL